MSEQASEIPNTKELYDNHKADQEAVMALGEVAAGKPLLKEATESVQAKADENVAKAAEIVRNNLHTFKTEAQADMKTDIAKRATDLREKHLRSSEMMERLEKKGVASDGLRAAQEQQDRDAGWHLRNHVDSLQEEAKKEMEADSHKAA